MQNSTQERYEVREVAPRCYRVFERATDLPTRGRFHSMGEADEWIDQQHVKYILRLIHPSSGIPSRARSHLIRESDYAGSHERMLAQHA